MEYLQLLFENISTDQKEMLIAILSESGFYAFEEEGDWLKAFAQKDDIDQNKLNLIKELSDIKYTESIIKEKNWNADWEAGFEPVGINDLGSDKPFAYIRADFHKAATSYLYDIVVTPKMSFGTGHHATTYLVVAEMSAVDFTNKAVIDFGTGTGILAILAEKMGATSILAIDCDDWSINNAKENIDVNGCNRINIIKAETILAEGTVDIILANINLNIIKDNLAAIKNAVKPGGIVLFSGIMLHDKEDIKRAAEEAGLHIEHFAEKDNWLAIYAVN